MAISNNKQRHLDIGAAILAAARPVFAGADAVLESREHLDATKENDRSVRERVMIDLAKLSRDNRWSLDDINSGVKMAATHENDDRNKKTLSTFLTEVKYATFPNVRDQFDTILAAVNTAWETEQGDYEVDKDTPRPIRAAFTRRYHAIVRTLKQVSDGVEIATPDDVKRLAESFDPTLSATKQFKRITGAIDTLREVYELFPVKALVEAATWLDGVTEEHLAAAKKATQDAVKLAPLPDTAKPVSPASGAPSAKASMPSAEALAKAKVAAKAKAAPVVTTGVSETMIDDLLNDALPEMVVPTAQVKLLTAAA